MATYMETYYYEEECHILETEIVILVHGQVPIFRLLNQ